MFIELTLLFGRKITINVNHIVSYDEVVTYHDTASYIRLSNSTKEIAVKETALEINQLIERGYKRINRKSK